MWETWCINQWNDHPSRPIQTVTTVFVLHHIQYYLTFAPCRYLSVNSPHSEVWRSQIGYLSLFSNGARGPPIKGNSTRRKQIWGRSWSISLISGVCLSFPRFSLTCKLSACLDRQTPDSAGGSWAAFAVSMFRLCTPESESRQKTKE